MRYLIPIFVVLPLMLSGCVGSLGSGAARVSLTPEQIETQEREASASAALSRAMQLHHDGGFLDEDAAMEYLNEAIELDPDLAEARYQRALLRMNHGDRQGAEADVRVVLDNEPDNVRAVYAFGSIAYRKGEFIEAAKAFSRVLELDDSITEAYAMRGASYLKLQRPQDAIHDFTETLARNPAHRNAYYNRALAYVALGDDEQAEDDLTQAMSLNSQSYETIVARAAVYMRLGEFGRAIRDYGRAIVLDQNDPLLHALQAKAYGEDGRFGEAEDAAYKAYLLARSQGDFDSAEAYRDMMDEFAASYDRDKASSPQGAGIESELPPDTP